MDTQNQSPQTALVDKIKQSTNILVTVSTNPTVDQLAACIGLTLWLNKAGKHATAVFSGDVPSTLEFLQPADTLEKNTDSLRDFIISLDKSKADKLRYKVEDRVVKVFITPYRTSLTADDLEFSQGDFNVDMVLALGATSQADLDVAVTAHGRILHDATVATITNGGASELGSINWDDASASSLSELAVDVGNQVAKDELDGQIATSLLTGIVAQTERFSNAKTTPQTMSISAQLMSNGANQQLVATKLDEGNVSEESESLPIVDEGDQQSTENSDGSLEIEHDAASQETPEEPMELPAPSDNEEDTELGAEEQSLISQARATGDVADSAPTEKQAGHSSRLVINPPSLGGTLTANSRPEEELTAAVNPLEGGKESPLLSHNAEPASPIGAGTLAEIEAAVDSPHLQNLPQESSVDSALEQVEAAHRESSSTEPLQPIEALNAQPIDLTPEQPDASDTPQAPAAQGASSTEFNPGAFEVMNDPDPPKPPVNPILTAPVDQPFTLPVPGGPTAPPVLSIPPANPVPPTSTAAGPTAPPPVPPPLMPPGFGQ